MIPAFEQCIVADLVAAVLGEQLRPQPDLAFLDLRVGGDRRVAASAQSGGEGALGTDQAWVVGSSTTVRTDWVSVSLERHSIAITACVGAGSN